MSLSLQVLLVMLGLGLLLRNLARLLVERWWRPRKLESVLMKQGLRGPPSAFLAGNAVELFRMRDAEKAKGMPGPNVSHDIVGHVYPEVKLWSDLYGRPYFYRWLHETRVSLFDPECFRDVFSKNFDSFCKSSVQLEFVLDFIGMGLVGVNGTQWLHHRTVVSPAFHIQKLKAMIDSMKTCTEKLVDKWNTIVANGETELEISQDIKVLAADVISHTAFGSNYKKGQKVFQGLEELGVLLVKVALYSFIPFYRYLPTIQNIRIWKLRSEIDSVIKSVIEERRRLVKSGATSSYGNDLLGLILEESQKSQGFSDKAIVDECKTFYLAGHETTASLLSWMLLLLALYPEWQEKARAEVQQYCGDGLPNAEVLGKLKVVGMVIYETLRLYPAALESNRVCNKDTVLSNGLKLLKGTGIQISILAAHHNPEQWGPDVNEFNPQRFAHGIVQACKHPNAFFPFSLGPRVCIGQTFALMEAKFILSTLLQRFSFRPSPNYKHNPTIKIVLVAHHGIPLIVRTLRSS